MTTRKNSMDNIGNRVYNRNGHKIPKLFASIVWIVFSTFLTTKIFAQDKKDSIANAGDPFEQMINYSRPGKFHQMLADLTGEWTWKGGKLSGDANPDSNKVEMEISGSLTRKPFANGRFFIIEFTSGGEQRIQSPIQNGKMQDDHFRSMEFEGYDNVKKKFVKSFINNHIGSLIVNYDGKYDSITKTIVYKTESEMMPGLTWKVEEHFIFMDKDHYKIEYYHEADGKYVKDQDTWFTRVKGSDKSHGK